MIEILESANGGKVLRFEGRLLSSRLDPQAEARAWLARRQDLLLPVKTIFVLGAGSGYHIAELVQQTRSRITVIEFYSEVIEAVQSIHGFALERVRFENISRLKDLRASEQVRAGVAQSFTVVAHPPSVASQGDFYSDCKTQLLGRDWGSLNWQWKLQGFAPLEKLPKIHSTGDALTIYDLESTELVQNSEERERMLIKALRELVK